MLEFFNKWNELVTLNSDKKEIVFNTESKSILLDGFDVNFPGEYEKSGILAEVKETQDLLFYKFTNGWHHMLFLTTDNFELDEDTLSFFGDIDVLVLPGTKNAVKLYENIEAKWVIPYGEEKSIFFNTLAQHKEEVENYKLKGELLGDVTEFINLK